jgi:hypothetical protein
MAVQELYHLLDRFGDEELSPAWSTVWKRVRDDVIREDRVPKPVIDKIDAFIQQIRTIDPTIGHIKLAPSQKVCLLLRAGASASHPSSIPTVVKLLPELWRRARKLGREDIDRLASWCDEIGVTNIEDLLTAAYLANFPQRMQASLAS